jgi:hypothetical protein
MTITAKYENGAFRPLRIVQSGIIRFEDIHGP